MRYKTIGVRRGGAYGGPLGAQAGSLFGSAINRKKGQSQQEAMQPQAATVIPTNTGQAPQDLIRKAQCKWLGHPTKMRAVLNCLSILSCL